MKFDEVLHWLRETQPAALARLWQHADAVRRRCVGNDVHLRGLVEISNRCARQCTYCGLRAGNEALPRYSMTDDEILQCAHRAVELGYGTLVLQSGEDAGMDPQWLADVIRRIRAATPLAVALSMGEWPPDVLALWREAGADRYLLRFETADQELFLQVHPPRAGQELKRLELLRALRDLDYEVGSGVLIGLPGQTYAELALSIKLMAELELDMVGCGPYIAHPATPLGREPAGAGPEQVPATALMTCKVLALARLACPHTNIPATTALATIDGETGYEAGLRCGANVIMPNLTPWQYRRLYEVYPGKVGVMDEADRHLEIRRRIEAVGRKVGSGAGDSPRRTIARMSRTACAGGGV